VSEVKANTNQVVVVVVVRNYPNGKNVRRCLWNPESGVRFEGFWASSEDPMKDEYKGVYPWPVKHTRAFSGEAEFLEKLRRIEAAAREAGYQGTVLRYSKSRGYAPSRFTGKDVGSGTYTDVAANIEWPEGYSSYYVEQNHVRPSLEFWSYVMDYREHA
jgi:hypothetical protein